jgi:hypothetical protein
MFVYSCLLERVSNQLLLFNSQPKLNMSLCFQEYNHSDNNRQHGGRLSISDGLRSFVDIRASMEVIVHMGKRISRLYT